MTDYFLANSLVRLRDELNKEFPHRDKTSDGWIGDPRHAATESDHNPDWLVPPPRTGVVRAIDVDVDDGDTGRDLRRELLAATIGDPRVWYVISNAVIYSRTHDWAARAYTQPNGHFHHVHISLLHTADAERDTSPWFGKAAPAKTRGMATVDLSNVRAAFLKQAVDHRAPMALPGVRCIQAALNAKVHARLVVDGVVGERTVAAYREWERRTGVEGRPGVPDDLSLRRLGSGRFRVAP